MLVFAVDDILHRAIDVAEDALDDFVCLGCGALLELYLLDVSGGVFRLLTMLINSPIPVRCFGPARDNV